jgi:hypothetical protein
MYTHLHIFFSLYTMTPFPTCYTTLFFFFPFPLIHSNFHTIYPYFSRLYITPHSTFHIPHSMSSLVARSIAELKFCKLCFFLVRFKCNRGHILSKNSQNFKNILHGHLFILQNSLLYKEETS